jgi:hypothetical protein
MEVQWQAHILSAGGMMKDSSKLYKYHSANCARINDAVKRIELQARRAVGAEDRKTLKALLPLYGLLIGASAETHLLKILFEPAAFDHDQRRTVLRETKHLERWNRLLETAFRAHNGLNPKTLVTKDTLPIGDFHIYEELRGLLDNELRIVIEIRNKLAHGQWEYPFNDEFDDILADKKKLLNQENLLSLKFKRSIISNLLAIIRDLAVSRRTLYRDFRLYYERLKNAKRNLGSRSYEKYKESLIAKRARGDRKKAANYLRAAVESEERC